MKTAREWFKMLPPDIEKMAVRNAKSAKCIEYDYPSLKEAMVGSWDWDTSLQGFEFWCEIYEAAKRGEYNK